MRDHWVNALLVFMTPQCNKPDYTLKVFLQRMAGVIIHIQMLCITVTVHLTAFTAHLLI